MFLFSNNDRGNKIQTEIIRQLFCRHSEYHSSIPSIALSIVSQRCGGNRQWLAM